MFTTESARSSVRSWWTCHWIWKGHHLPLRLVLFVSLVGDHLAIHMNMDAQYSDLQAVFTDLRSGVVPAMSTEELARQISSAINSSPHSMTSEDTDMTCMLLTLTGKIICKLSSKSLPRDVREFYDDVTKRLFGAFNMTADLVSVSVHSCWSVLNNSSFLLHFSLLKFDIQ